MSRYLGDIAPSGVIDFTFTTLTTAGVASALTSGAVAVYKANSDAQSTAGVTLTASFDGVAGLNHVRIDTSADGTFYAAGSDFNVVLTAGTVNSVSVAAYSLRSFSIHNRSALRPTTAGRTLDVSAGGEAGLDFANIGSPTTTVNLSGTTISAVSGAVGSVTGAVGSVTGNVGGNVTGTVASVVGNVGGNVTGSVGSVVGAVGSVTGNVGGNVAGSVASVTTVNGLAAGVITAASIASDAITAAKIATGAIDADALAADAATEIVTAILDLADGIETGLTPRQALRIIAAATAGKLSGGGTATEVFRNAVQDSKDRITATVTSAGNRTAITYDLT